MTKVEICENKKHTPTFSNLRKGDYFWLADTLFIKIYYGDVERNSVALEIGETYTISEDADVIPINSISICIKN